MRNNYYSNKDAFFMHLRFIGLNMERFYNNFKNSTTLQNIIKFWKIDSLKNTELSNQING